MTTLGELKVRCVKKTQMDDRTDFTVENLDTMKNDFDYQGYLNNVLGCINDGIQWLVANDRIPFKKHELNNSGKSTTEIVLSQLGINDIKSIQAIYHQSPNGVKERVSYIELADTLELEEAYIDGSFIIIYSPSIRLLTDDDPDTLDLSTLGLRETHCTYLVYYSRNELYGKLEGFGDVQYFWKSAIDAYFDALKQEINVPRQKKVKDVIGI